MRFAVRWCFSQLGDCLSPSRAHGLGGVPPTHRLITLPICHSLFLHQRWDNAPSTQRAQSDILLELTLSHCENVTDDGIRQLCGGELRFCLESIDLDNCPLLTDHALRSLSNCPKLKSLKLFDCLQITRNGIDNLNKKLIWVENTLFRKTYS